MTANISASLFVTLLRQPWNLWFIQSRRMVAIELRRNLFSWKASWIYFLALAPVLIISIHLFVDRHLPSSIGDDTGVLAAIVQFYYVRLGIFFGCLGIFSKLIRGEMIERSLHFYLLSPVRRELLLLSKFIAGSISALFLFGTAMVGCFTLIYLGFGVAGSDYVFNGPGFGQLAAYLLVITLACLGYGSVFLLLSMIFKNPTPAAMIFLGWEAVTPVLPPLLQRLSVAAYLRHLMPVHVPAEGIFALLSIETEPISGWVAISGLLFLISVVLTYSCYRMRTLEIRYASD